jgi:uncharacterized RDD family membrane protein YckC
MTDDRYEPPLFDPPEPATRVEPDTSHRRPDRSPGEAGTPPDDPVHVERLDLQTERRRHRRSSPDPAGIGPRLAAGFIDLVVHLALVGVLIGGSAMLDVSLETRHWPAVGFMVLLFSFLYHVVPLAFWGNTPGMAVAGLRARTLDDEPLSMPQATRRWLALVLTVATAGLGVLLALGGRSLADRLSGSQTLLT